MRTTFWVSHEAGFYFRLLGYGLSVERDRRPSFSERYGYKRVWRIGRWAIEVLS
jgi:hypothetical protein